MNSLVCPYCNTPFDLPGVPGRVVCPRCGEAIPAKLLTPSGGPQIASADRPAPIEAAPASPMRRPPVIFSALVLVAVLVGLGIWYYTNVHTHETRPTQLASPPTRPPNSLPALRRLPADTQIVIAVQPPALIQYAERAGKTPEALLAELGVPVGLLEGLAKAGIAIDGIDHLVVGVGLVDSPKVSVALFLQKPLANERQFREAVNLRLDPDKPGQGKVDLPGFMLPMSLLKADVTTYLFSTDANALEGMNRTQDSTDYLKPGLVESIKMLDPASFAWVATDNLNWSEHATLKLVAGLLKRGDDIKRLKGIRALAIGLTLRRDLNTMVGVRFPDAKAAGDFDTKARVKLAEIRIDFSVENVWLIMRIPRESFESVPAVLALFDP